VDNTDENLRRWIENPSALKPGVKMPAFGDQLRPQDLDALVAYLRSLE
jgi:cytochrome c oxidase subunit II